METTNIQARSTKDRLNELRELQDCGYVTESEFKIARVNILKDGGIDVVTQLQHAHRPYLQQDGEEERKGCGCFLLTLLLTTILVLSAAFFAVPYWPDRFGGARARTTREWLVTKSVKFIGRFFEVPDDEVSDPVSSDDRRLSPVSYEAVAPDIAAAPDLPDVEDSSIVVLTSFDADIPLLPSATSSSDISSAEPGIAVAETQAPVSAEPSMISQPLSADLSAENVIRGSVTYKSVRIRSAPDTSANDNVTGWASAGDSFIVLEEGIGRDGSQWYNVVYDNGDKRGWIRGSLVKLEE